jgi:hypothetical protein
MVRTWMLDGLHREVAPARRSARQAVAARFWTIARLIAFPERLSSTMTVVQV